MGWSWVGPATCARTAETRLRGLGCGAQHQGQSGHGPAHELVGHLQEGEVYLVADLGGIVGIQPPMLRMPDHADDLDRAQHHKADLPADGVLTRKEVLCQDVVDY